MATIFRPPTIFRNWRRDPNGVATAAQDNVTQNRNVALLLGKDTIYRGPGQVPSYDWPNPTLAKSRVVSAIFSQVQVWQNGLVNLLVGKDTFFRGPGQAPNYDWPNPTLPKSSFASLVALASVWQNRLVNLLVGNDRIYGGPGQVPAYDWPNPTLAKSRTAALLAEDGVWQNRLVNLLVGKDTFFRGPGQAPVYDWPNPLRVDPGRFAAVQALVTQNLLGTLLAVTVAAAPFTPLDQPNPRGTITRVALNLAPLNLLTTTLVGQDAIYGGPGQVPSYDWPNPRGARALYPTDPLNLLGSTLAPATASPFAQTDWPNPRGLRGLYPTDPPNLLGTTLAPIAAPFTQGDWPNPRGAVNRAALDFVPPYLFGTTLQALPVGAALWPQPIGRSRLTVYDSPNLLSTLLAVQAPFYQNDWPNPRGAIRGVSFDQQDILNTTLRPIVAGAPFYQTNWPNPIVPGPRFALKVEYAASQNFYPPTPPPPPSTSTPEGRIIHFGRLMIRHS